MALSSDAPTGVLLASAARTADAYSDPQVNDAGYPGLLIMINCTADPASAAHNIEIEAYDPASGAWRTYDDLSATVSGTGTALYLLMGIGLAKATWDASGCTASLSPIPYMWRLFMDAADADSITYSVGYQYVN
jgi:hypothetical protein